MEIIQNDYMLLTIDVSHSFYLSLLYKMSKRPADTEIAIDESAEKKAKLSPTHNEGAEESKGTSDKKTGVWVSVQISLRSLLSNRCYLIVVI